MKRERFKIILFLITVILGLDIWKDNVFSLAQIICSFLIAGTCIGAIWCDENEEG